MFGYPATVEFAVRDPLDSRGPPEFPRPSCGPVVAGIGMAATIDYSCRCRAGSKNQHCRESELKKFFAASPVLAILLSGLAFAHAKIVATVPADGDYVPSPRSFVLDFDNEVSLTGAELHTIEGVSDDGRTVEGDVVTLEVDSTTSARRFVIDVPAALPPGEYYLLWRCIAADSHFSSGEFFFTVIPNRE